MADHPLKKLQGWDLDAFLATNEQFHRALDLFCFATLIFNMWWANLLFWSAIARIFR